MTRRTLTRRTMWTVTGLSACVLAAGVCSSVRAQPGPDQRGRAEQRERAEREQVERQAEAIRHRIEEIERERAELAEQLERLDREADRRREQAHRGETRERPERPCPRRCERCDRGPVPPEHARRMQHMLESVEWLSDACFEPHMAGMIAIGALKEGAHKDPAEAVADYHALLKRTETLGFRTAIRLALKDLYKARGNSKAAREQLRMIVVENDHAIIEEREREEEEDKEEEDEEEDETVEDV